MAKSIRWLLPSAGVLAVAVVLLGSNLGWRGPWPYALALGAALLAVAPTAGWGAGVAFGVSLALAVVAFLVAFAAGTGALSLG